VVVAHERGCPRVWPRCGRTRGGIQACVGRAPPPPDPFRSPVAALRSGPGSSTLVLAADPFLPAVVALASGAEVDDVGAPAVDPGEDVVDLAVLGADVAAGLLAGGEGELRRSSLG